jgi:MerR family transcriptional regulator, light-induced transcriptional regulator
MTVQQAADALGVHYQTAYGWVRSGVLVARKSGRSYFVSAESVQALRSSRAAGQPPQPEIRVRDWAAVSARFYDTIINGRETLAQRELDRLARGVPVVDLCQRVVSPALRRLGAGWAAGTVTIATEHRASAICERLVGGWAAQQPTGRPRGIAIATTPPGERHGLPALMATACLRQDRWLVHHLACDLPVAEVGWFAGQARADLVVLSAATTEGETAAVAAAGQLAATLPDVRVLAGRPGDSLYELLAQSRPTARPAS